jgi:DNA (cytosine-5)-methyltransferase 1
LITDHFSTSLSAKDREIVKSVPPGGNWRDIPDSIESRRLDQIRVTAAEGLGSRSTYYGRLQWHKPAYTISTYIGRPGNGCFIHPSADRLITIREAARIQSFPDSYDFYGTARQRQIQVGNAVPPILAYQLGKALPRGRFVDVFCGAGGLSLGLEWAGFECIAAVDSDKAAIQTFEANHVAVRTALLADLADPTTLETTLSAIRQRVGNLALDLLVGGPPCQGFSTAGKNLRHDPRNNLVWSFVRLAEDLLPNIVLMENVPALAWKRGASILIEVRKRFASLRYHTSTIIAHAEGYGVPQLRRRLFLIAVKDIQQAQWPVPGFTILPPYYKDHQPFGGRLVLPPFTVNDAISDLPASSTATLDERALYACDPVSQYQRWARGQLSLPDIIPELSLTSSIEPNLFQQSFL